MLCLDRHPLEQKCRWSPRGSNRTRRRGPALWAGTRRGHLIDVMPRPAPARAEVSVEPKGIEPDAPKGPALWAGTRRGHLIVVMPRPAPARAEASVEPKGI